MRKLLLEYLNFWWRSKNHHAVHSPFVFNFLTKCLYAQTPLEIRKKIHRYIDELRKDETEISITDLGSGSQMMKTNLRKVSSMAKNAGSTKKQAERLFRIVNYFECESILELGTSLGISSYAMGLGNKNALIKTVEGCPNISGFTSEKLKSKNLNNIDLITSEFSPFLNDLDEEKFDLIYIDGNHQKQATIDYFKILKNHCHNDSLMIFDDIHWSEDMKEAWNHIREQKEVSVSIDTFYWGLVFFRKEQKKEHFTIRV